MLERAVFALPVEWVAKGNDAMVMRGIMMLILLAPSSGCIVTYRDFPLPLLLP
ncbi:MAG: hypothetical protein QM706_16745 [Nitrospira sp.]